MAKNILISCGARLPPFDISELRELMSDDELELDKLGGYKKYNYKTKKGEVIKEKTTLEELSKMLGLDCSGLLKTPSPATI